MPGAPIIGTMLPVLQKIRQGNGHIDEKISPPKTGIIVPVFPGFRMRLTPQCLETTVGAAFRKGGSRLCGWGGKGGFMDEYKRNNSTYFFDKGFREGIRTLSFWDGVAVC